MQADCQHPLLDTVFCPHQLCRIAVFSNIRDEIVNQTSEEFYIDVQTAGKIQRIPLNRKAAAFQFKQAFLHRLPEKRRRIHRLQVEWLPLPVVNQKILKQTIGHLLNLLRLTPTECEKTRVLLFILTLLHSHDVEIANQRRQRGA